MTSLANQGNQSNRFHRHSVVKSKTAVPQVKAAQKRQSIILLAGAALNGLILFFPATVHPQTMPSTAKTALPPVSEATRDHYTAAIAQYNLELQSTAHTQQTHLQLANALANVGCREAASEQYLMAMSQGTTPHIHQPVQVCAIALNQ